MAAYTGTIEVQTEEMDIVDISGQAQQVVEASGIREGIACIFNPGSTGAITTIEHEPGLLEDLPAALERIAPHDIAYRHEERWHDGNGHSHIRASLIGPSIAVPVIDGTLQLGTWQQIVFVECDVKPRQRSLIVQVTGD